jgi:transcriptional regulator with XRE-family HTH domain
VAPAGQVAAGGSSRGQPTSGEARAGEAASGEAAVGQTAVGRRIQSRRTALGLTQAEVAAGMLSPSYLSLVESGRRQPASSALEHIATQLGVDADYLRDGIDAGARRRARLALGHAEIALQRDDYADAYKRFSDLESDPGLGDEQQRQARLGRARAAERSGDLEESIQVLSELADAARREPGVHPWMDVAEGLCRCYREAGDLDLAIQTGEAAMRDAAELGLADSDEYVRLGCTVMSAYYERGDLAQAAKMGRDLTTRADSMGAPHTRGAAYWNAAVVAEARGEVGQALALVDRALALFGESEDRRNLGRLRIAYAWVLLQQTPPAAAQALAMLDGVRDDLAGSAGAIDAGYCDTERARALLELGRLDEARKAAESSLAALGDRPRIESARAQLVLGRVLRELGDQDGCLEQCATAAATLDAMGANRQAASAWRELGDLYRDLHHPDRALDAFDRALRAVRVPPQTTMGPLAGALPS